MRAKSDKDIQARSGHEPVPTATKPVKKKKTNRNENNGRRRCLSREEAEELLRQHCRGLWSDSDDEDVKNSKIPQQKDGKETESEEAVDGEKSTIDSGTTPFDLSLDGILKIPQKKRKSRVTPDPHVKESEASATPLSDPGRFHKVVKPDQRASGVSGLMTDDGMYYQQPSQQQWHAQKNTKTSKKQSKGLRKWSGMRSRPVRLSTSVASPSNDEGAPDAVTSFHSNSKSLQILKELGGATSSSSIGRRGPDEATEQARKGRASDQTQETKGRQDAEKVFDETVHEIRNMVYPHLGRFQRRQFVMTALRALGIGSTKTQKMPLPELLSRKKATAAALKARRAEAKILGIKSHIDSQGSIQQAARNRSKIAAQKQKRKHLRETFQHAGKYTGNKRPRSLAN